MLIALGLAFAAFVLLIVAVAVAVLAFELSSLRADLEDVIAQGSAISCQMARALAMCRELIALLEKQGSRP
jgi:hypothetical protein